MKRNDLSFALAIMVVFAVVGAGISIFFSTFITTKVAQDMHTKAHGRGMQPAKSNAGTEPSSSSGCATIYSPPSPNDAPPSMRDAVMLGYNIITQTQKYAAQYVGNKLNCGDCHFRAGITKGGKSNGISFVGIGATYPQYRDRKHYTVDLVTRTNDCFKTSMTGKPLPPESKEMTALITYYQWISKGLPIYADIPWLGLKHIENGHKPDKTQGEQIFNKKCSVCHGKNGQGSEIAPPIWGKDSFNDGAAMSEPETLFAFVYLNMPKGNPDMTEDQAMDTSYFVTNQPRPHFFKK
jgi:thiosulfate dehydrogenase